MTPYLLAVAGVVLPLVGAFVADLGKDMAKDAEHADALGATMVAPMADELEEA